ncbi:MAG: EF-hand domain-containing protein [Planctomycetota bacterium]|nr:EF-hand domain-containing protein [Planctomycetota bacterium]
MKKFVLLSAAALVACAGSAMAQTITVDGSRDLDNSGFSPYGAMRWIQNNPTGFGDNSPPPPCDPNSLGGNPAAVATGIEFKIPLSALGAVGSNIRIMAQLSSGGHDSISNQVIPGLPAGITSNLGEPRSVDYTTLAGNQFVTVSTTSSGTPAVIDGSVDTAYGAAKALQTNRTNFGDANQGLTTTANGSELNGIYAYVNGSDLYIVLTGNLNSDFTKLEMFIDNGSGLGFNQLTQALTLPDVDFQSLQRLQGDGVLPGLKFDAGFQASHFITFGQGGDSTYFPNIADLVGNAGSYLGSSQPGLGGVLSGGTNPDNILIDLNNSNTAGVANICLPPNGDPNISGGSEINGAYGRIADGKLYLLVTGNLQTNFNKLPLFFDVGDTDDGAGGFDAGQNVMRNDNVDIDFGGLNRMAGLTFEEDFSADYWLNYTNGGAPNHFSNAAVLRANGPRRDLNTGAIFDYGAFAGGAKSFPTPLSYDGTRLDQQTAPVPSVAALFTQFAPRTAGNSLLANYPAPAVGTAGLIQAIINNSNLFGVTGDSAEGAQDVETGLEVAISLSELGYPGSGPIKIAGAITSGGYDFWSNQVLGGLSGSSGNLGEVSAINFQTIAGRQYITVSPCRPDVDGSGFLDSDDFVYFVEQFNLGVKTADYDGSGFVDSDDFVAFVADFATPPSGC